MTGKSNSLNTDVVTTPDPLLVNRKTAASLVAVSVATWDRMASSGKTPRPVKLGGRVLWRTSDLELWTELGCPDCGTFCTLKNSEMKGSK